ncbi:hypothetical protein AM593_10725, partial [Mytilus galloprovincialis]
MEGIIVVVFAGQDSSNESTCIGHSIQKYQIKTAICCRHGIEPRYSGDGQEQACCFRSYNTKTERCCDNGPIKFQKHSEQCCGATLYDSKAQGCCGTSSFNISTHTCCASSGNMVAKYTDDKCCGTTTYNSKTKVCCAFENKIEIVNKSEDNHDSCCSSGSMNVTESYSKNTHYCSLGKVISNDIEMCGSFEYKKDSDICCQGVFEKDGKLNGKKCCGVGTFSKATHHCCTHQIYSRKERRRCGKKPSNGLLNRRPRNMKTSTKGVCRICNDSKRFFVKALKSNGFDVCKRQALKVRIISQRRHSGKRRIKMIIQTDLYSEKDYERKKIEVLLPCSCRRIRASKAILITELEDFRETVRLGDSDILLPWYSNVRKHVLRQWKTCKTKKNDLVFFTALGRYLLTSTQI